MHAFVAPRQAALGHLGYWVAEGRRDHWITVVGCFAELAQKHEVQEGVYGVVVLDAVCRIRADCAVKVREDRDAGQEYCRVERQPLQDEVSLEERRKGLELLTNSACFPFQPQNGQGAPDSQLRMFAFHPAQIGVGITIQPFPLRDRAGGCLGRRLLFGHTDSSLAEFDA
ncbi:hypothetical protein D3C85_904610 [compost metagenome]